MLMPAATPSDCCTDLPYNVLWTWGVYACICLMHGLSREQSKSQHAHYTECIISPPCTATSVAGEKADIPCILTVAKEILTSLQAK